MTMHNQNTNGSQTRNPDYERAVAAALAPSLKVAADMQGFWQQFSVDGVPFDQGAEVLIQAHKVDGGDIDDIEVADLKQWPIGPHPEKPDQIAIADLPGRRHLLVRATAFQGLLRELGPMYASGAQLLREGMPASLQTAVLNSALLRVSGKIECTFRVRNNEIVSVVSRKYASVDTDEMIQTARDALRADGMLDDARVSSVAWGGRDVLRIIFPRDRREVKAGDIVLRGVDISNGSFGGSAIRVATSNLRLICLNGMTRNEKGTAWNLRHVGKRENLLGKVREVIPAAFAESSGMVERFAESVNVMVGNLGQLFSALQNGGMLVHEQDTMRQKLRHELGVEPAKALPASGIPLFDVLNSLTETARDTKNPERRMELESMAGDVLYRRAILERADSQPAPL